MRARAAKNALYTFSSDGSICGDEYVRVSPVRRILGEYPALANSASASLWGSRRLDIRAIILGGCGGPTLPFSILLR